MNTILEQKSYRIGAPNSSSFDMVSFFSTTAARASASDLA
jgi:hypothetical protein